MNDSSRAQGGLICVGVVILAAWFLLGLLQESYWALAIPVAIVVFFALGLTFWVGYTIATIQVEPFDEGEAPGAEPSEGAGSGPPPTPPASPSSPASPGSSGTPGASGSPNSQG